MWNRGFHDNCLTVTGEVWVETAHEAAVLIIYRRIQTFLCSQLEVSFHPGCCSLVPDDPKEDAAPLHSTSASSGGLVRWTGSRRAQWQLFPVPSLFPQDHPTAGHQRARLPADMPTLHEHVPFRHPVSPLEPCSVVLSLPAQDSSRQTAQRSLEVRTTGD